MAQEMKPLKILFICTHNRCRSILAEAVANHFGYGLIAGYSAGSAPAGEVHPVTLSTLARHQISIEGLNSESWDEFDAVDVDVVITVCDSAAQEACPLWLGSAEKVHWGLPDPSVGAVAGSQENEEAFDRTVELLSNRIKKIIVCLKQSTDKSTVVAMLKNIAEEKPEQDETT